KLPAVQTQFENCVAHNGSLIPIPGRDVMVQAWYQGGISVFDWTDPDNPVEIAFHDRGPSDATRMGPGGSWSVYWYNGSIVSSEIARGLDIFALAPSAHISQNEIDAANTVRLDYLNTQGQPQFVWPPSFPLARAYVDQLERHNGLSASQIASVRTELTNAERASGASRRSALTTLATTIDGYAGGSVDAARVRLLARAVRDLAGQ
ncbi:MAG: LVIVD repeat-containing protein, partial [Longimicrobiales bacterium]